MSNETAISLKHSLLEAIDAIKIAQSTLSPSMLNPLNIPVSFDVLSTKLELLKFELIVEYVNIEKFLKENDSK